MPQQINLCTPILLAQKRYFSAQAMLQSLAVFGLLGGALMVYGVWSLNAASRAMESALSAQKPELLALRAAIADAKPVAATGDQDLSQPLQTARARLLERQKVLSELRLGLLPPGGGHSARLKLIADSIPAQAWVTHVRADEAQLEVQGFTGEPAVLNDWVAQLAQSPLLMGQQLVRVKVERASTQTASPGRDNAPGDSPASALTARALWSFSLTSALPSGANPVAGNKL